MGKAGKRADRPGEGSRAVYYELDSDEGQK